MKVGVPHRIVAIVTKLAIAVSITTCRHRYERGQFRWQTVSGEIFPPAHMIANRRQQYRYLQKRMKDEWTAR
jgi:hypothetical protein